MSDGRDQDVIRLERLTEIGEMWHDQLNDMPVREIQRQRAIIEYGTGLLTNPTAKALQETLLVVMADHLEMREANEPERWARETEDA